MPERSGDREILAKLVRRLERTMELRLQDSSRALEKLQEEWVFTHPERLWENAGQTLDTLCRNLEQAGTRRWRNVSRSWISWQPSWGRWTRTECSGGAIPLRKMPREGPSGSRRTCTLVIPW